MATAKRPFAIYEWGHSRTKQSFKDETDINLIMARHKASGVIDHLNTHQGDYGNFIGYQDYHTSLNQILEAEDAFLTIPAKTRSIFDNDPGKFLAFVQNPDNLDEMIELGLAPPKPVKPPPGANDDKAAPPLEDTVKAAVAAALADQPAANP